MMLRASSSANDLELDLSLVRGEASENEAVQHAPALANLVDSSVNDLEALSTARAALVDVSDKETMIDACAVVANFEMMTRIADGTGTRHPPERLDAIGDMSHSLGLDQFTSARI
jgi:hypothetical protein